MNTMRRRANTCTSAESTSAHARIRSVGSITPGVPSLSQESSSSSSTASDVVVSVAVASSQDSVIAETRGNTPARDGDAGGERDKGGLLLGRGDVVDSPSRMFHSSPVPAPVSSLRSTCA
ncbi:uncharacterized protein TRIREDRAFT_121773 [Trichoderma reesei QM6a]|uniref:Predicted protein n=2 Tax=Hypocrea jecorina TaxID=51453 RepID=G0RJA7_HYPJQ|nr:uncharacterized protein TRIREDRAFT_121773 [Trichoderma reesei QM6a]EGR48722.1 predicted protein [Trichoderma reesei QM6a]ETS01426.1 hypothetical protein M419DRAFT_99635 [Trichoderma reesei RUT C-30]